MVLMSVSLLIMGGGRVGVGVRFFSLGSLGLVSKINFVEGGYKESLHLFSFLIVGCRKGKKDIDRKEAIFISIFVLCCWL